MEIIQEEKDYILVHKEAFLATQTARIGEMDLYSKVKNYLMEKNKEKEPYLALINRLDQPVEGLVLFARNRQAAADLSSQLQNGKIQKYYLAAVYGNMQNTKGQLTDYIRSNTGTNLSKIVSPKDKEGKKAVLSFQVIRKLENITLIEIHLQTGRHHQIRVQLSHAGFPLIGDTKYGNEESMDYCKEKKIKSIALCAYKLAFLHPLTGEKIEKKIMPMQKEIKELLEGDM